METMTHYTHGVIFLSKISFVLVLLNISSLCGQSTIQQRFRAFEVVPDVISTPPICTLGLRYSFILNARGGNVLWPSQLKETPEVLWGADPNRLYTLILTDPDAPSHDDPQDREFLHWLVINIPGLRISAGDTIFDYVPPQPPPNTGFHRYVALLYQQPQRIEYVGPRELKNRARFSTEQFTADRKLGVAVAGNFFLVQHEGNQQ